MALLKCCADVGVVDLMVLQPLLLVVLVTASISRLDCNNFSFNLSDSGATPIGLPARICMCVVCVVFVFVGKNATNNLFERVCTPAKFCVRKWQIV